MKVGSRCGYCLLHRGYKMINLSTQDEEVRREAMTELLHLMGEQYNPEAVPSVIGADRGRVIARVTGCKDPYKQLKKEANQQALALLPGLKKLVVDIPPEDRLRLACLISCLGNVVDYDVPGNNSDIEDAMKFLDQRLYVDDTDKLKALIKPGTRLLFFTDNAGEIAFDTLVVEELKALGCHVTVAVKGGPGLNDALMEDAETVGMTEVADEVITTGTDAIGVRLDESPDWFLERYYSADIIVAKGMANWETLTETPAPCPLMYLFRTKCEPVARAVGAPEHENIGYLVEKGWKL
ncbi:MAG: ARMT1-like domain-containing protein [Candidatus Bathyarchaeota archaeon]|nr:ARMT1-like domain-containing protein [Candidatus Bathyarchaeota archaeon]